MPSALIKVAQDTINLCKKDKNTSSVYEISELGLQKKEEKDAAGSQGGQQTVVTIRNSDYITIAYNRAANGRVAILNMCSDANPGGGFLQGTTAGEEELCRRSSLYQQLIHHQAEYPFRSRKLIYSKGVTIFKAEDTYARLKDERDVDVISIAALRQPRLNQSRDAYLYETDRLDMRERVNAIIQMAEIHDTDCLVLSAFGSGCFGNPPEVVARLFKERLAQSNIKEVVFGILDDRLRGKTTSNHDVYSRIFS